MDKKEKEKQQEMMGLYIFLGAMWLIGVMKAFATAKIATLILAIALPPVGIIYGGYTFAQFLK